MCKRVGCRKNIPSIQVSLQYIVESLLCQVVMIKYSRVGWWITRAAREKVRFSIV